MAIQIFDDGSTLETFDDGSTLATGTEGDVSSSPAPNDTPGVVEVKTAKDTTTLVETSPDTNVIKNPFSNGPGIFKAVERNILHKYRSWTYNWTLGAIGPSALANHKLLERDIKNFTVLNSAGKGTGGIGINVEGLNSVGTTYSDNAGLISSFNSKSAGRFDMFIDNISVDSIIGAGSKQGGSSIATNITFDVFEPYSMNGFIEALQFASKGAGYSDYMKGAYALRIQFQGWPDGDTSGTPEIIPMSTRYFPITIAEVHVDVTEAGTRYRIGSVPVNQMGLGSPNALTSDILVAGNTVGEILKNFFEAINQMVESRTKEETQQPGRDRYEISCPKLSTVTNPQNTKAAILNGTTGTSYTSDIIKSEMNDELTSVNVFRMGDPAQFKNGYVAASVPGATSTNATSNSSTGKLNPKTGTVTFAAGAQIHDCIAAVVRDSQYTRNLLKPENLDKVKNGDGYVTYFTVRMETDINGFDTVNSKHFQTYRYVLEPYRMHYTRIPGQEQGEIDLKAIKETIKREYDYIYTGKNVDILKFSLKFDNLYYTAIPAMMGNRKSANQTTQAAGRNNLLDVKRGTNQAVVDQKTERNDKAPMATTRVDPDRNKPETEATAGNPQSDPYTALAKNLHEAILNNVDMIGGTVDILGDPYYLVTGGMGNADLTLKDPFLTTDGQAPVTQGDVFININFKNPIDIDSKTGGLDFGPEPLSFSGIYRITTLKNNFRDGVFTQTLDLLRIPGQIVGAGTQKLPSSGITSALLGQQKIKDTAPADILKAGIRPSDFNLANLIKRGLPSSGLPGALSNFTNSALGGTSIGSITGSVGSLLNQVSGASGIANQLTSQLGISPLSGVNALTSGIRLSASGLGSLSSVANIPAAGVATAGAAIGSLSAISNAPTQLAGNVSSAISALPTANIAAVSGQASSLVNSASALTNDVTNLASKGASAVSGALGNAKNAIAGLQNVQTPDIAAVGSKLGIDPSALAGMSPDQISQMTSQLESVAKNVPENTDLGSLKDQGISFANLTGDKLKNLPAIQPKVTAPDALQDPALAAMLEEKYGSTKSLLAGSANLAPLTDINKVTNPAGILSAGSSLGFGNAQSLVGSVANANSLVNNTIGSAAGIANNVGSLAQNSIQGFSPASIGLGSVESNITNVANIAQSGVPNNLGISVASQFGSLQSSPLAKLVKDNNISGSSSA